MKINWQADPTPSFRETYDYYKGLYMTERDIRTALDIQVRAKFFPKSMRDVLDLENPNMFEKHVAKLVKENLK